MDERIAGVAGAVLGLGSFGNYYCGGNAHWTRRWKRAGPWIASGFVDRDSGSVYGVRVVESDLSTEHVWRGKLGETGSDYCVGRGTDYSLDCDCNVGPGV